MDTDDALSPRQAHGSAPVACGPGSPHAGGKACHARVPLSTLTMMTRRPSTYLAGAPVLLACLFGCALPDAGDALPDAGTNAHASLECGPFTACGGDLAGRWRATSACPLDLDAVEARLRRVSSCAGYTVNIAVDVDGTVEFYRDGSMLADLTARVQTRTTADQACAAAVGAASLANYCTEAAQGLQADPLVLDATCAVEANVCACDVTNGLTSPMAASQHWETQGSRLTLTPMDDQIVGSDYCVDGDVLSLRTLTDSTDSIETVMILRRARPGDSGD